MATAWYFAYGSNMNPGVLRGRRGVAFDRALPARLEGWRLVFDKPPLIDIGESFANLIADRTAAAYGVLFEVADDDLAHIDLTEGVLIGNYRRIEVAAVALAANDGGAVVPAQTLVSDRRDPALRPSDRYMDLVIAGALTHGLPAEHVDFLRSVPCRPSTPEALAMRAHLDAAMRRNPRPGDR